MAFHFFDFRLRQLFWNLQGFSWDDYLHSTDYQTEINEITGILRSHSKSPNPSLLDIGCATGCFSYTFAENGFNVVGLDYARNMLRKARAKKLQAGTKQPLFVHGNYNDRLKFNSDSFDIVFASHVFQGTGNYPGIVSEISRVIRKNGLLALVIKQRKTVKNPAYIQNRYLLNFITKTLKRRLVSRKMYSSGISDDFFENLRECGFRHKQEYSSNCNLILLFEKHR